MFAACRRSKGWVFRLSTAPKASPRRSAYLGAPGRRRVPGHEMVNGILNSGGAGAYGRVAVEGRPSRSMLPLLAVRAHPFNSALPERAAESVGFHYLPGPGGSDQRARPAPGAAHEGARRGAFAERIG